MTMSLVIHAPNVHMGGGLVLLKAILDALDGSVRVDVLLDRRAKLSEKFPGRAFVHRVEPTPLARIGAEWRLRRMVARRDTVLCFGNLPPLLKQRGKVILFVQNRYLVERKSLEGFPVRSRWRIRLERLWFALGKRNVDCCTVQTPSMRRSVMALVDKPCLTLPFLRDVNKYERVRPGAPVDEARYEFVYVASGEPHKNHRHLIEAWILLSEEGIRPKLVLTLDERKFPDLCAWIEEKKTNHNMNITVRGNSGGVGLRELYSQARALIYPSDFESLGLPLIEARCAGLGVLASERDYVRDVLDPDETFDPNSAISIARAAKRFLGIPEPPLPLVSAKEYLEKILEIGRA